MSVPNNIENNKVKHSFFAYSKIPSLDGLRAISILLVLIAHFNRGKVNSSYFEFFGLTGVYIFFIISGFLITSLLLKEKLINNKISLKYFYIRRLLRIFPLLILFLIVLSILNQLFSLQITNISFISSLLFLKNLPIPHGGEWYSGHLWSLSTEEQFYLIFPFIISRASIFWYKRLLFFLIIFLPLLDFCFFNNIKFFLTNKLIHELSMIICDSMGRGTVLILIGSYFAVFLYERPLYNFENKLSNNPFLSFIIFCFSIFVRAVTDYKFSFFSDVIFAFLIGITIILNLNTKNWFSVFLNNKWIAKIGILSYSIYIWQQLFTHQVPWSKFGDFYTSFYFNLPLLLIVSYVSYTFYEKRFLDLRKNYRNS